MGCTTPRVNCYVNYALWVMMACQCSFITGNKYTTLVGAVDNRGGCAPVRAGVIWKIPVSSPQFCCEPETAPEK